MNPLTQIPARVRGGLYWAYVAAGTFFGGLQVAQVEHLGHIEVVKALAVMAYIGTALGVTAASNLRSKVTAAPANLDQSQILNDQLGELRKINGHLEALAGGAAGRFGR
ncbi:hypothetical protein [Nocardioides sp.]|jgi:hypothetical protein|uniref:hypothetical protein n=1 Tax=Nocardioides sp. TaxID=35761 RepID=UPI0031FF2AFF|nr:hypothetical protein [Nocardioides sp.]